MKAVTKLFISVVSMIMLFAMTTLQINDIKKAEWLIGTWINKTPQGNIYETWSKTSDAEFAGKSYMVKHNDTIFFESVRLVHEKKGLFYISTVEDQNAGLPVRFSAKTISETQLVFTNPQHDFPQTISYTKITADSLIAEISAANNGQERRQVFPMKRLK